MSETASHFVAVCPNCLVALKVRLAYSGSYVQCKHCEHKFRALPPDHLLTPSSEEYEAGPVMGSGSEGGRINLICPNCSSALSVRSELAGHHIRCKQCQHKFLVQNIEGFPDRLAPNKSESHVLDEIHARAEQPRPAGVQPEAPEQPPHSSSELTEVRDENARLGVRLEALQQDHAAIQSEKYSLQTELEQLRGEHDRLRSELERDRLENQRSRDELAALRDALGGSGPEAIAVLRQERQTLSDENQQLRDQVQGFQADLSSAEGHARALAERDEELRAVHSESEELKHQVGQLEERVNGLQAERDRLAEQCRDVENQLTELQAQRAELEGRVAQHSQEMEASQLRSNELTDQLRQRDSELATKLEELERLASLRHGDTAKVEELRNTLARREEELAQEVEALRRQIDELHSTLSRAEQAHGEEKNRLAEEHHAAREELAASKLRTGEVEAQACGLDDAA